MDRRVSKWFIGYSRGELYGIDLEWVREIDYHPQLLPLPTAEPPLCGLLDWHGAQLPAVSLDSLVAQTGEPSNRIAVILEVEGHRFALLVEAIGETIIISQDSLFILDPLLTRGWGGVTRAARIDDRLIFQLELQEMIDVLVGPREMGSS